ncbi:MAG TPA: hypothetical protein VF765_23365 [Polyangiaceae bacterium]
MDRAAGGSVFGFTRHTATVPATFITIDTASGAGMATPNTFTFTNGWSGAGVSTSVVAYVPPPGG